MALSKPEKISRIDWDRKIPSQIQTKRIMEVCRVEYNKAVSVEIIEHLLGGPNMEYNSIMEVENSIDCFAVCKSDLLDQIKSEKKEIMLFEDRQSNTSNILIVIVKQSRTNSKREHIVLHAVIRLTIMMEPKVGFARFITATGKNYLFRVFFSHGMRY